MQEHQTDGGGHAFLAVEMMKVAKSGYLGMRICIADVAAIVA